MKKKWITIGIIASIFLGGIGYFGYVAYQDALLILQKASPKYNKEDVAEMLSNAKKFEKNSQKGADGKYYSQPEPQLTQPAYDQTGTYDPETGLVTRMKDDGTLETYSPLTKAQRDFWSELQKGHSQIRVASGAGKPDLIEKKEAGQEVWTYDLGYYYGKRIITFKDGLIEEMEVKY